MLLKYKCHLCFSLLFYLTVSALLKTSSGYLQMGRCLGEQTAGGAVRRESSEMDFLPFTSLGSPGMPGGTEEGRAAGRAAAGSFPCSPGALTPRAGRRSWLILFPFVPHPNHTLPFKTLFSSWCRQDQPVSAMTSVVISPCPLWCHAV